MICGVPDKTGLRANRLIQCLMATFFESQGKLARGATIRPRTNKHLSEETLREVYFQLGCNSSTTAILREFGAAESWIPKIDFRLPLVPWPFLAHLNEETLQHNCKIGLQHLGISANQGDRSCFVSIDETCFHSTWSLMSGLFPDQSGGYCEPGDNWAVLQSAKSLPKDRLAKMSLHYILSRSDSYEQSFDMMLIPFKPQGKDKSENQLNCLGQLLLALSKANRDTPPLGASWDGGSTNVLTAQVMLAQVSLADMAGYPFFEECQAQYVPELKHFPFGILTWRGHAMHGSQDPLHVLKRFSIHHACGSRSILWGSLTTDMIAMVEQHLPLRAFLFADEQSDKEALQRMNSRFLANKWNQPGCHIFCLVGALLSYATLAGDDAPAKSRMYRALVAYYLLLLGVHNAKLLRGTQWEKYFLPRATVKLCLQMMAHVVLLARFGAKGASVLPSRFAARMAELHFSDIKKGYRGSPCLRDILVGTHRRHLQHARLGVVRRDCKNQQLEADAARAVSKEAFQHAMLFQSWMSVNRTPEQIGKDLDNWWRTEGKDWLCRLLALLAAFVASWCLFVTF